MKEKEAKPIITKESQGNKVTCIDISKNGEYLTAGFGNGGVLLWDLTKGTSAKFSSGVHCDSVLNIKFTKDPKLWTVSSDVSGFIVLSEYTRSVFGMSSSVTLLMKQKIIYAISPLLPNPLYQSPADSLNILGLGGVDGVMIVTLEPTVKILWELKRKSPIKRGIPYIEWGRGVLPGKQEKSNLILAIAWDKVIQLVEVRDPRKGSEGYILNGYYESEIEIQLMCWITDSVILTLNSRKEINILHTGRFSKGRYQEKNDNEIIAATI
jgi:WD40 repeat protein